jgi:hypothetical protein
MEDGQFLAEFDLNRLFEMGKFGADGVELLEFGGHHSGSTMGRLRVDRKLDAAGVPKRTEIGVTVRF